MYRTGAAGGLKLLVHQGVDLLAVGVLGLTTPRRRSRREMVDWLMSAKPRPPARGGSLPGAVAVLADDLAAGIQLSLVGLWFLGRVRVLTMATFL